mmetsp:Transcript_9530/g.10245  ORF Transcript_9530/g.10245 Transcript_9530/m.10245 type:complete len:102 (+) Transcript_9530:43-348(+)|eukprot:CAMPEP_0173149830 /NCGR_PEP_ID=MMETSP1105-20130129/10567_1 /TAXON_ID=2985 /ORGANISM="Ochromonas sp., Strain BG-1" /LENGTH=101 /DNA_ID=CAMNT_0014064787 /DNA_START=62 /DNA_END=367 /DNA_ORIENTATION=-
MSIRPSTASNEKIRVPPGGFTSVVFNDYAPPVKDLRISYSVSTLNTFSQFESPKSPFSRPAKKGLGKKQSSMKDILEYAPITPRRNENRPPPGGKTTIQLA